jgi:hypothetical protein
VLVELVHDLDHAASVLVGLRGSRQAQEKRWQHLRPVDSHLPEARFIGEEDDVVVALVDVPKQAKDDLDGLADLARITFRRLGHAAIEEAVAVGDEGARASGHVHEVLRVDVEALVVLPGAARRVERSDHGQQVLLPRPVGAQLLHIQVATDELPGQAVRGRRERAEAGQANHAARHAPHVPGSGEGGAGRRCRDARGVGARHGDDADAYSSVSGDEMKRGLARVVSLAGYREAFAS